jgi:protocatechuate 3,4-dioxygenase beta subunit
MLLTDVLGVTKLIHCLNPKTLHPINYFLEINNECENGSNICLDGSDKEGGLCTPAFISGRLLDSDTNEPVTNAKVDINLTGTVGGYPVI